AALIFCRYTPRAGPCPLSLHDALPILGWWVRRRASQRVRPAMAVGIAVVVVPSFIASLLWTNSNAAAAFFVTPTRLWELGLGAMVAIGAGLWQRLPRPVSAVLGWAGLAAVLPRGGSLG